VSSRNIKARKRLSELFKRGIEVRFDEDGGHLGPFLDEDGKPIPATEDQVAMWIQAPSPFQREMALRDAQAARAKALLRAKRDEDSEESLTSRAFLAEMTSETLLEYVLMIDEEDRRNEAIREVLGREEWEDFPALQDAFRRMEEVGGSPEDEEWKDLMEADRRYGREVAERENELTEAARQSLQYLSTEELERRALEKRSEVVGSQAFMSEYEKLMLFYSIRDMENTANLFFDTVDEWNEQPDEIRTVIVDALSQFVGEATEAKNSPGAVSGLDSSALPSEQETSEGSIPQESNE
jgi:hypothetical protein